jgi:uncharacterized FlaG/YvyC family protein
MDVSMIRGSSAALQVTPVTTGQTKVSAQSLQEDKPVSGSKIQVMDQMIDAMENGRSLEMHFDKDIGRVVVQVMDEKSGRVVFQVPSDDLVKSIKSFRNYLKAAEKGV